MRRLRRRLGVLVTALVVALVLGLPSWVAGQDAHEHPPPAQDDTRWHWRSDAAVVAGWNYQYRKFRDFQRVESENWFSLDGGRTLGDGRLQVSTMFSLEPFTIQRLGSAQVFQTGETYQ